eukprot:TRINITY_DN144_c0_g1_i1.p1 TRINITY_DN144_c0_g1~~TRINITY_DN144_c0_g1_i1.p1  ORF type:complete len:169 (-),score=28.95 TRINITY_DN144_c0_g1_i1:204-710(-)
MKKIFAPLLSQAKKTIQSYTPNHSLKEVWNLKHLEKPSPVKELASFKTKEALNHWQVITDNIIGGQSTAQLVQNNKNAVFEGKLSLKTSGKIERSGFAVIKSQKFDYLDLTGYDALEMRLRTDGRLYVAQLKTAIIAQEMSDDLYQIVIPVKKPNVWTRVVIFVHVEG